MKLSKVMLAGLICLLIIPIGLAKSPPASVPVAVAGIYENFTVGQGSGDLEGMRVVIIPAGGGHYAMVQIAQGGAEDPKPEFVQATVNGMKVSFTVGDQKFTGTVNAAGMRVQTTDGQTHSLKRRRCASLFG